MQTGSPRSRCQCVRLPMRTLVLVCRQVSSCCVLTQWRERDRTRNTEGERESSLVSLQFSRSVVSDSLWPHGLQHTRPLCPSPTPGVYSNSCPMSRWCHPTVSSSGVLFSSHLWSFPASESFPMSQFFASGGQTINFSFSISPSNEYSGRISFRMDWLDLLAVQGTLKSLLQHNSSKAPILWCSAFFTVQGTHKGLLQHHSSKASILWHSAFLRVSLTESLILAWEPHPNDLI